MAGFGSSPVGSNPFGYGTPVTNAAPPLGTVGSRYIDPLTRDYAVDDSTGQMKQMPSLRQRVYLTVMTVKGSSSSLPNFGLSVPGKLDQSAERRISNAILSALNQLIVVEKILAVNSIAVERYPLGRVRVNVSWTDLTVGKNDTTSVVL
jgi:phage baseplate assembly protein W